ncbi:MAG: MBL fold metallo-hydrolase [Treponema sp.]|nr:MBL fold metallo-hydrolase [Treponema sp.]
MKMTLLGTGTSQGVPAIGCDCKVCTSSDPHDNRLRCSAYIVHKETELLIDVGPEFRLQALRNHIKHLDAVLISHSHADHLHGLDDLRIFSHTRPCDCDALAFPETEGNGLPIYANANTLQDIRYRFDYLFKPVVEGGGVAKLDFRNCSAYNGANPIRFGGIAVVPIPLQHGSIEATGWLLSCDAADGAKHSIAYLTDCNAISEASFALIKNNCGTLDHLVIDGLRVRPHSTHFSFDESLAAAEKLSPRHTWLIHMNHDLLHTEIQKYIDTKLDNFPLLKKIVQNGGSVSPGYDQLELEIPTR